MANDRDVEKYLSLGSDFYQQGKYDEAIEKYKRASRLDSNYADACNNWGNALYYLKKYDEAIEKYKKAIESNPNYPDAYNDWGRALYDLRRYDESIEKYKKTLEIDPYHAYASHNIADVLWKQGRYKASIEEWEKALNAYELTKQKKTETFSTADFFQNYGNILHLVFDRLNEAEEIYKEGLLLDTNHIGILIGLVSLFLEKKSESTNDEMTVSYWKAWEAFKKAESILKHQLAESEEIPSLFLLGQL